MQLFTNNEIIKGLQWMEIFFHMKRKYVCHYKLGILHMYMYTHGTSTHISGLCDLRTVQSKRGAFGGSDPLLQSLLHRICTDTA